MDNHLDLADSSEPRFEWPTMACLSDTATTASLSPNNSINNRLNNLELLVNSLLTRIVELEKINSDLKTNTRYNWYTLTNNNIINKKLSQSRANSV
jgi:hypothetical protein